MLRYYQSKGLLIGGIIGVIIGISLPFIIPGLNSLIIKLLIGLFCIPIGSFLGFLIARGILEKQVNK